jgi:hypothetical protein
MATQDDNDYEFDHELQAARGGKHQRTAVMVVAIGVVIGVALVLLFNLLGGAAEEPAVATMPPAAATLPTTTGTMDAAAPAATAATAPVSTASQGDFNKRQLPPYQPTISVSKDPSLVQQAGDGETVVISGKSLEAIEAEAERQKRELELGKPQ